MRHRFKIARLMVAMVAGIAVMGCGNRGQVGSDADTDGADGVDSVDMPTDDGPCVPLTCEDLGTVCGTFDDGCGGTIDCLDACTCTEETYETDCPARACEIATGCDGGICVYGAVDCGGSECVCRLEECDDYDLRSCGDRVCTDQFCDPRPSMDGGRLTFENMCVSSVDGPCGTCGLGLRTCDSETDTMLCDDIEVPDIDPEMIECDSTLSGSTFVFVDTDYTGGESDGSRARPFLDPDEAITSAVARNARGVVIGASPVFTSGLGVENGVSVYGGYGHYPEFIADRDHRPAWEIGDEHLADGRLVGVIVDDLDRTTLLVHLAFRTASLAGVSGAEGASNYGLYVSNAPTLKLDRVEVEAGSGGAGTAGVDGSTPAVSPSLMNGLPGGASDCYQGTFYSLCFAVAATGGAGAAGGDCSWNTRGLCLPPSGGIGGMSVISTTLYSESGMRAPCGAAGGAGGTGGTWPTTVGLPGDDGEDASVLSPVHGAQGVPSEEFTGGHLVPLGSGGAGQDGRAGGGGGGGGSGGGFWSYSDPDYLCINGSGGGGGGAGGCGGTAGTGGQHGGYSMGLFVVDSDGIVLEDCDIRAGDGGAGGNGGIGGTGGLGGTGGAPGDVATGTDCLWCAVFECGMHRGGYGGNVGDGQDGGNGGGGAGGSSIGAYCRGSSPTIVGTTAFVAGSPGAGGMSGSTAGNAGAGVVQRGCAAECGNASVEAGEQCDDGNTTDGDGCESDCTTVCGDGFVVGAEECDDSNTTDGDGCESDCTTICGDGFTAGAEECDDGNTTSGDGCESGCTTICGDGFIAGAEQCDDGNREIGDGCSLECLLECGGGLVSVTNTWTTTSHWFYPHLGAVDPVSGNCLVSFNVDRSQSIDWVWAEVGCITVHGHLVSLGSTAEEDLAKTVVPISTGQTFPIGLNDRFYEGHFWWSDRSFSWYSNWETGRPSTVPFNTDDCVYIWGGGSWRDIPCLSYGQPYVCEIPMRCP